MHITYRSRMKPNAQGMVEFALILPILLAVLFAIVDFGWIVFNYSQLYNGAREGVRFGAVQGFGSTPQFKLCDSIRGALVAQAGFSGINASQISVWYDDGRDIATTSTAKVADCYAKSDALSPHPGVADQGFKTNSAYRDANGNARSTLDIANGDRIVVSVNVNVQFLTPFLRTLAKGGLNMSF